MSCSQFDLAELYDFSDGSLDPSRRLAVEAHLHRCSDCRGAVADVSRIAADLENVCFPVPEPSQGFRDRVLAGADVLLSRLAESGGSLPARPPQPVPGIDGDSLVASRPWYVRPIPRFLALAGAILVVLAGLMLSGVFTSDKYVVASIRDIDGLTLNDATATGLRDLFENDRLETEPQSGGSFVSLCGMSVVLGAASRVVVLGRGRDGCIRLRLAQGSAWICTDDSRTAQSDRSGVDVETDVAEVGALKAGELFLQFSPESRRLRVEVERGRASVRSVAIERGFVDLDAGHALEFEGGARVPRLGRASVDDVALAFLASVGERGCGKRTRIHYDRAKKGPIHWVSGPECALKIAIGFRRPIFALSEDAAIDDQAFEQDEALRLAASRFVCVRFERETPEARALLSRIEDPEARVLPRILLCPRATFMGGFSANAPLPAIIERMENVCVEVLGRVLSAE